jgi:hypothetical protein
VYADIKLWRWISIQPEFLLNVADYTQTWDLQSAIYKVSGEGFEHKFIGGSTYKNPERRYQPNPNLRLVVKPVKRICLQLGFGYTFGTQKLQEFEGVSYRNGIKVHDAKTWIDGSKYAFTVGAALLFGKLK